jgi:hypothetical protein
MDHPAISHLNGVMARCKECNSVITRTDSECFICGDPVPGRKKTAWQSRLWEKKDSRDRPPVTPVSNLLFIASIGLTLFSLLAPARIPVSFGATLGGLLFVARIVSDRWASRRQSALRPVTVTRLDY